MLEELKGARITGDYPDSGPVKGALYLSDGREYTSKVSGGGYDRINTAIAKVVQEYLNEELTSADLEEIPEIYGLKIEDGELLLNGGSGPKCWRNLIEHFGFKVQDSNGEEYKNYIVIN